MPKTNIRERLERGVVNDKWWQLFPTSYIQHLPHSMSDHCPLLNTNSENPHRGNLNFKFEACWLMEETLEDKIKASWGSSANIITEKLKRLQSNLLAWARLIKEKSSQRILIS